MSETRTPGPWKIRDEKADFFDSGACFDIDTADGRHIGFVTRSTCGIPDDEALANAAFIVRACNAHEDLVLALRYVVDLAANQGRMNLPEMAAFARAALAKAEWE